MDCLSRATSSFASGSYASLSLRCRWLYLALSLGLVARLVFETQLAPYPRHERLRNALDDQSFFVGWAAAMARGEPYDLAASPHEWAFWAAREPQLPPQAPLYPAMLALLAILAGSAPAWIRAIQVAAGLATIAGVFLVARRRFGEAAGGLAALGAALYAPWIFFEATVLRTTGLVLLFVALIVALDALAAIESFAARRERLAAVAAGALCGGAILFQEQFLLVALGALLWLARQRRGGARWLALGSLAVLLPVVGWASIGAGRAVLSTASAPYNLLIANLHDAGGEVPATTPTYDALKLSVSRSPGARVDLVAFLAQDLAAHPASFVRLLARKTGLLFRPLEIPDNVNYELGRRENPALRWLPFDYPTLLPLALAGVVLAGRRRSHGAPLGTLGALYALSLVAFVPLSRLRQPLALLVIVFAAAGATELWRRLRARRALPLLAIGALLVLGATLRADPGRAVRPTDWQMAGAAWENEGIARQARGHLAAAREAFVEALVRNPGATRAKAALRSLDAELGTLGPRPLEPGLAALCEQASQAAQGGDLAVARRLLERAARQAPAHPRPWQLLANVLYLQADHAAAATALERAVAADPYDPLLAANLASLRGLAP